MKHHVTHATDGAPTMKMAELSRTSIDTLIQLKLVYVDLQPVVDLRTGAAFGYEALARCRVEEVASPLRLLSAAVDQGAIGRLGRELRARAIQAIDGKRLFMNLHPEELDEEYLVHPDDPIFTHTGQIVLEVPEATPLVRYRFAHSTLAALRARGMTVALDDFGAGYSNIGYITNLAPEFVKIDRELIAGVSRGSRQQQLLASLVMLCRSQGAQVIAEGIETQAELEAVIEAGVPLAQGYYLGRPSANGAIRWHPT